MGSPRRIYCTPLDRIAKQAAKLNGEDDAILAFDPSGFEKEGKNSAGVARQYLGRYGKVDNGQVGTFLIYVAKKEHVLVNGKLFIPQEWNDDPTRCEKARIPKNEYEKHKTRHEHCLKMLDHQGKFLPHACRISEIQPGDDELGRSAWFRRELRNRNEKYVLAVPGNANVRDLDLVPEYKGRGAVPKGEFRTVADWKDFVTEDEWHVEDVRDGEKNRWSCGWQHHMALSLLAAFFLTKETLRSKKRVRR